jgi:hypothetical protein
MWSRRVSLVGEPHVHMQNLAVMARWLTIMNEKSQAREAEKLLCVSEIVLGRALEGRDSLARVGTAERMKRLPSQARHAPANFSLMSGAISKLTGRAIDITQDAYRGAAAQMKRLTRQEDADTEAGARQAIKGKALTEDAERRPPKQKHAADTAARREPPCQAAQGKAVMDQVPREVTEAQPRAAAHEAAKRTAAENPRLKAEEILTAKQRKQRAKPLARRQSRVRRPKAERVESDLAQERACSQELEQIRKNNQKLLAQALARVEELEQVHQNDQKLLTQERARIQVLEQQLSIRQNGQNLLVPRAHPEAAPLMEQARLLLDQGNILAARRVLERAVESGNARALFLLAETYDPASLSAWGMLSTWSIFGRRGDVTKARDLYAKASARGVHEANYRLSALQPNDRQRSQQRRPEKESGETLIGEQRTENIARDVSIAAPIGANLEGHDAPTTPTPNATEKIRIQNIERRR